MPGLYDHRGRAIAPAGMGFVPSEPRTPRRPPEKEPGEPLETAAIGFITATEEESEIEQS